MAASTHVLRNPREALQALVQESRPPQALVSQITSTPPVSEQTWRARLVMQGIGVHYVKAEKPKRLRKKVNAS